MTHACRRLDEGPSCGTEDPSARLCFWPSRDIDCPKCEPFNTVFGVPIRQLCDADYALAGRHFAEAGTVFPGYFCAACTLKVVLAGRWRHNYDAVALKAIERDARVRR